MFTERVDITGEFEVLSPLHVGSGGFVDRDLANAQAVGVAALVRDHRGLPCLPGAGIKGVLRDLAQQVAPDRVAALFGQARDQDGAMGRLLVRAALMCGVGPGVAGLPHGDPETGVFIDARTRIDRATGTALDAHLFHAEMVAPGCRFQLRLILLGDGDGTLKAALDKILDALTVRGGVAFGRGQGHGQGRMRLVSLAGQELPETPPREADVVLRLDCPGPYLTLDSSRRVRGRRRKSEDGTPEALSPLLDGQGRPVLRGSQVLGVLRSRAAWLDALAGGPGDDADRQDGATDLTPVERLFGVSGFRGLVNLEGIEVLSGGRALSITSVALDQFSMAPLDGALFTTSAYVGCSYRIRLSLDRRRAVTDQDEAAFQELIADLIEQNDLMLGHGTNKGYGWFTVSREADHG